MAKLKIVTVQGFTKADAIAKSGLNLEVKFDATTAWKKDEQPSADSTRFKAFAEDYLKNKLKNITGAGCAVTVESGVADSRERPYKVENHVTDKARKYKTVYEGLTGFKIDDKGNITGGTLVLQADTKGEAEDAAKEFTTANRVDVAVRLAKVVSEGKPVAMVVKYTPSINTNLGTYVVFGYETEA